MRTTDILRREHALMASAADRIEATVQQIARGDAVSAAGAGALVSALQILGERCHHPKEQRVLFPALAAHGVPRTGGLLGEMTEERERIRRYALEMADSSPRLELSVEARARFCTAARACVILLREHVGRQSDAMFSLVESLVDGREDERLAARFLAETSAAEVENLAGSSNG